MLHAYAAQVTFVQAVELSVLTYSRLVAPAGSVRKYKLPAGAVTAVLGLPAPESTKMPPGKLTPRPAVVTEIPLAAATLVPVGVFSTKVHPAVVLPTLVAWTVAPVPRFKAPVPVVTVVAEVVLVDPNVTVFTPAPVAKLTVVAVAS